MNPQWTARRPLPWAAQNEARRIAANIAKLPDLLKRWSPPARNPHADRTARRSRSIRVTACQGDGSFPGKAWSHSRSASAAMVVVMLHRSVAAHASRPSVASQ
jgi:hypothetical protein